jgi:cysteine desulfurase
LAVGAAKALELAMAERETAVSHAKALREQIYGRLLGSFPDVCRRTGHPTERLPFHASVAFRHLNANDILMHLDQAGVAAGSGSACTTGDPRPSATLAALGLDPTWTKGGLRFTVGRQNTPAQINYTLDKMDEIAPKLYKLRELM